MKNIFMILFFIISYANSFGQMESVAVIKDDQKAQEYLQKADEYIRNNDFDAAIVWYSKALPIVVDEESVYLKRSVAYMAAKDYKNAIPDYTKLIEFNTLNLAEAYFYRGLCKVLLDSNDSDACIDLGIAKKMGFDASWENFKKICYDL